MLKIAYHPIYTHPLPPGHRFPMAKYELIPEQLLYQGIVEKSNFFAPDICRSQDVLLTHNPEYLDKLIHQKLSDKEQRAIGFPQSDLLTQRELIIAQGTMDCCGFAGKYGAAMNIAGGTHHAFADKGEGFCMLNDQAIAANYLLAHRLASRILIIDLDVHQGNGTAKIFENNAQVFTFSMHGKHNYPFHKQESNLDIELEQDTDSELYLKLLEYHLPQIINQFQPDFAFYLAGVDILDTDRFGKLKVSMQGCKQRDLFVFNELKKYEIPVVVCMGGGYSPEIKTIVDAHCATFRAAQSIWQF